ncbi:hypothetical protein Tco_1132277 [Tanacetum coccineum]|uniref:Uncharacterized protein n=1 Tax=Tanacetum coccineum TaxID=301880 RepID=A0ABQ5JBF0_9ASTR
MRIEKSLNITFVESLPEPKLSPSVDEDRINEPIVQDPIRFPSLEANVSESGYPKSIKEARGHLIEQVIGERMVPPDILLGSLDNVLDNKIFDTASNDSHPSNVEMYLNDEKYDGDNMIIRQTPNEETRTGIDNTREENMAMFMSFNDVIKLLLSVATNMSCIVKNGIGKEGAKDNFKKKMLEVIRVMNSLIHVYKFPNGKLTHARLKHAYMLVACVALFLFVASSSQEHFEGGEGKQRARAYEGEDKLLKLGEDKVQASAKLQG